MPSPHKHAAAIKAWADGATIEVRRPSYMNWVDVGPLPMWQLDHEYRVKPTPFVLDLADLCEAFYYATREASEASDKTKAEMYATYVRLDDAQRGGEFPTISRSTK